MAAAVGVGSSKEEEGHRSWHTPLQGTHSIYPAFVKATRYSGRNIDFEPDRRHIKYWLYYLIAV